MIRKIVYTIWFLTFGASAVFAQALTGKNESVESQLGGSLLPSFGKVGLILALVIVGIYLTLTLLKRMMGRRVSSGAQGAALELVETCYLSPKKTLSYVRLGNKSALLAVTENSISSVMELDSDETSETLEMIKNKGKTISFTESLSKARRKIVDLRSKRSSDPVSHAEPVRQEAQ